MPKSPSTVSLFVVPAVAERVTSARILPGDYSFTRLVGHTVAWREDDRPVIYDYPDQLLHLAFLSSRRLAGRVNLVYKALRPAGERGCGCRNPSHYVRSTGTWRGATMSWLP